MKVYSLYMEKQNFIFSNKMSNDRKYPCKIAFLYLDILWNSKQTFTFICKDEKEFDKYWDEYHENKKVIGVYTLEEEVEIKENKDDRTDSEIIIDRYYKK